MSLTDPLVADAARTRVREAQSQPDYRDLIDKTLRERFGLTEFRPMQREAIESLVSGRDTFVVMPTGGGKSLCYQLPALIMPGTAIIVSPLIALMKDQVDRLQKNRIPAAAINSHLSYGDARRVIERATREELKLLFVSPERFESRQFKEDLPRFTVSFIAIDEAHCISEWGNDFRTSYRRLPEIYTHFSDKRPPVIALTATATEDVRKDIVQQLKMRNPFEVLTSFERSNLHFGVLRQIDKDVRLTDLVQSVGGGVIVYGATRKSVDKTKLILQSRGLKAEAYHGGMKHEDRRAVQDRFLSGRTTVITATNAFGMGIDKPDVRAVIHYEPTASIESYYQESGRAGRDGSDAIAVMMFNNVDPNTHRYLIESSTPTDPDLRSVYGALHDIAGNPLGMVHEGLLVVEESNILRRIAKPRASLDRIIEVLEDEGLLLNYRAGGGTTQPRFAFTTTPKRLEEIKFRTLKKSTQDTINALLRTVGHEAFEKEVFLNVEDMLTSQRLSQSDWKQGVRLLEDMKAAKFTDATRPKAGTTFFTLQLLGERVPNKALAISKFAIEMRLKRAFEKLEKVTEYAVGFQCRRNSVLEYFGERPSSDYCGKCDVCIARAEGRGPDAFIESLVD